MSKDLRNFLSCYLALPLWTAILLRLGDVVQPFLKNLGDDFGNVVLALAVLMAILPARSPGKPAIFGSMGPICLLWLVLPSLFLRVLIPMVSGFVVVVMTYRLVGTSSWGKKSLGALLALSSGVLSIGFGMYYGFLDENRLGHEITASVLVLAILALCGYSWSDFSPEKREESSAPEL